MTARANIKGLAARLIWPALLVLTGIGLIAASPWTREQPETALWVASIGKVCIALAVGWAIASIVDWRLKRTLKSADVSAVDNLRARKLVTRVNVLRQISLVLITILTVSGALMFVPGARQIGVTLFASAGVAGLVIGLAAGPVLSNLIAGLQIAFTQPVRLDDAVIIEGEWGWIEEIELFHVIVRIWDERRLVVPLTYIIQNPFQNWTYKSADIIGSIFWTVDFRAPIGAMREKLEELCKANPRWDGRVCVLQVTEAKGDAVELRALASARNSPDAWDLRCEIREGMLTWLQEAHPEALPQHRLISRLDDVAAAPGHARPEQVSPDQRNPDSSAL